MQRRRISLLVATATAVGLVAFGLVGTAIASGDDGGERLSARMTGAEEVPPVGFQDPDSRGRARFEVNLAPGATTGELCFSLRFDRVGTPNRGHIHSGVAGQNGGIVVPLFELADLTVTPATDPRFDELERGGLEGCVTAPAATLQQIQANPAAFYCNLHNTRAPGGALRGQLS